MEQPGKQIQQLLDKDTWTDEECRWLLHYLESTPAGELHDLLWQRFQQQQAAQRNTTPGPLSQKILQRIHEQIAVPGQQPLIVRRIRPRWWRGAAAAAAIIVVAGAAWLLLPKHGPQQRPVAATLKSRFGNDVAPGGNKARLVLGNGQVVILEETADGIIDSDDHERIHKKDAALVYENGNDNGGINTLSTPRGGQYKVVLADGTKVWLNAASSLQYPASFKGSSRQVMLSGEAYFEVAADAARPFLVQVQPATGGRKMQVQVLGTHFNVKAYTEEGQAVTTLLQGAVRVSSGGQQFTLAPGQQASLDNNSGRLQSGNADTENALAWKNGLLAFNNDALPAVMRTISRWYDVDVVYEEGIDRQIHVSGAMRKQEYISKALEILELTAGVHFTVKGRTITVTR